MSIVWILLGLVALVFGAEGLVRGASRIAQWAGLSPLVVGLTVVAFGTSAPELAVSVRAALDGTGGDGVALGNVMGSNLFNTLVILGLAALAQPLIVSRQIVRLDAPLLIGITAITWLLALDGTFARWEGMLFFGGIIAYTVQAIWIGKRNGELSAGVEIPAARAHGGMARALALTLGGLTLLVLGADWLVKGATDLARAFGVSDFVIGLTIVAGGTSLPELATSVLAAARGHRDLAVGNVIGSNIFNLLAVLGLTSAIAPIQIPAAAFSLDFPILMLTTVLVWPLLFTGHELKRWEGALLLAGYGAYLYLLIT